MTEQHQVIDVVTAIEQQTSHGGIRDDVFGKDDGAHVQHDEFLNVFHFFIQRQFHLVENLRHHLGASELVAVKCPSNGVVPAFCDGFGNVVQQGGPAQPKIAALFGHMVEHLQCMVKIVFVTATIHNINPF